MNQLHDLIRRHGRCGITGRRLRDSRFVNLYDLDYYASWPIPTGVDVTHRGWPVTATTCLHESSYTALRLKGPIRFAIECRLQEDRIIYHALQALEPILPSKHPPHMPADRIILQITIPRGQYPISDRHLPDPLLHQVHALMRTGQACGWPIGESFVVKRFSWWEPQWYLFNPTIITHG